MVRSPTLINRILVSLCFTLFAMASYAQEDCFNGVDDDGDGLIDLNDKDCSCIVVSGQDTVWGDFEDYSCCPTQPSGTGADDIGCLEDWSQAGMASTDYFNTCGMVEWSSVEMPLPPPSGEGAIGFISVSSWHECVGLCLPKTLICDNTYTISLSVGFNAGGWSSNSPFSVSIFGTSSCDNYPAETADCLTSLPEWMELGTASVSGDPGTWTETEFTFVPPANIEAIAIGAACSELGSNSQYHFLDNVILSGIMGDESVDVSPITITGDCETPIQLSIDPVSGATYQWYLNGVAIPGANSTTYEVPDGGSETDQYTVVVDNGSGCGTSGPVIIDIDQDVLSFTGEITNVACMGDSTGSIDIELPTSSPPFIIEWSTGQDTEVINDLPPGLYTVTVTNANGCFGVQTFFVNQPPTGVTAQIINVQQPTPTETEGSAEVMATGGLPPYTYQWDNGETTPIATMLAPGEHTVTITDANGCEVTATVTILTTLLLSADVISLECQSDCVGSIELFVSGGLPAYTFQWSNGASTQMIDELCSGMYTVTLTDNAGTEIIQDFTITSPPAIQINSVLSETYCYYESGFIELDVSGGVPDYQYAWSTGATTLGISDLNSSDYSVTVTDASGCTEEMDFSLELIPPTEIFGTVFQEDCGGGGNGAIDVTVDGNGPFAYEWSDGSADQDLTGVSSGIYGLTVTDTYGCTTSETFAISQAGDLDVIITSTDASCQGADDGSISVLVEGGIPPYEYSWSSGQMTADINDIAPGEYIVTVTDDGGCEWIGIVEIAAGSSFDVSASVSDPSCFGFNDGVIEVEATSSSPPFNFIWSNGATNDRIEDLVEGVYAVTISDGSGCSIDTSFVLAAPSQLSLTANWSNASCADVDDGSADVVVTGGVSPYTYTWSNGQTVSDITGLEGGTYGVTVTDANGCTSDLEINLETGPGFDIEGVITSASCNGGTDGAIDITVMGGMPPFNYNWSSGLSTEDLSGLSAGNYTVTVTDVVGCREEMSFMVSSGSVNIDAAIQDLLCFGDTDASIDLTPMGGTPPFQYQWSHGPVTEDVQDLSAGMYSVTVSDAEGCVLELNYTINEIPALELTEVIVNVDCNGSMTGSIELTASGGMQPYSYQWSNGNGDATNPDLSAGTQDVTVTDANGCTLTNQYEITEPPVLTASVLSITHPTMVGEFGSAEITVNGGIEPYIVMWENGESGTTANQLDIGPTTVTITDANGCIAVLEVIIEINAFSVNYSVGDNPCFEDCLGTIDLEVVGGIPPFAITWSDGQFGMQAMDLCNGTYEVTITDSQGAVVEINGLEVISPPEIAVSGIVTGISCIDSDDGSIISDVSGGSPPYQYTWSNGATMIDATDLSPGVYSLTVTDAQGCQAVEMFELDEIEPIEMTVEHSDIDCFNDQGSLLIIGANPNAYEILINGVSAGTGEIIELQDLAPGEYVIDYQVSASCVERIDSFVIGIESEYFLNITPVEVGLTAGESVEVTLDISGTITGHTIDWSSSDPYDCITEDTLGNCLSISITPTSDQTVTAVVVDEFGCRETVEARITLEFNREIFIPNVFSPNGDGINDVFKPHSADNEVVVQALRIFSRWGEELHFESAASLDVLQGWDGNFRERNAMPGVYVYTLTVDWPDDHTETFSGDVTLVR